MSWINALFSKVSSIVKSPALTKVETAIEGLLPYAITIVQDIDAIAPSKTLTQLNAVATKYALPAITALADGQTAGNVALNLGTQILAKNHAPAAATSLLNTVIQLAVVGVNPPSATVA